VHAFPEADIPVVQLSINALKPFDYHFELGAKLAPLRDRGVLIVGSGNVVHNLRAIDWDQPHTGFSWAERFGEDTRSLMLSAPAELSRLIEHRDFTLAAPTPDHFFPLAYIAGLASTGGQQAEVLVDGYTMGSLSMASYTIGAHVTVNPQEQDDAPMLPKVPADETNL
jgi:4,5-DOPA dioxygenase extradiol